MRQFLAVSILGAALAVAASAAFASDHDRDFPVTNQAPVVAVPPAVPSPAVGDQGDDIHAQPTRVYEHDK